MHSKVICFDNACVVKMKTINHVKLAVFVLAILFMDISFSDDPSGCSLNFTAHPYLPSGECIGTEEEKELDGYGFPTTRCCQNGLNAISEALAVHAVVNDSIFLPKDQWESCDKKISNQQSVSIHSCGFKDLYNGSNQCSSFTLSTFKSFFSKHYQNLLSNCSQFHDPSFDDSCKSCTDAIKKARETIVQNFKGAKDQKKRLIGTCGVLVVTSVAAAHIDDAVWIDDYYRCLPAFGTKDAGYIKVKYSLAKALLAILVAIMAVALIIVLIKYVTRKPPPKHVEMNEKSTWSGLYRFSKAEIENAIRFSERKVSLGAGSAGRVYKGVLPSGQVVAIKHIYKSNMSDSFTREVEGLSRIRHPNLVCLFGCCTESGEQYLVYEYCPNGNLAQHLQRKDIALSWDKRVKILRDCALALRFLHSYPDGCIVHRDIKLTNILLTENMDAKLSDFGLAKMLGMEESKVFTDVRGTIGYMDPEYMTNAKLSCASDVYSFGIVILQLLSGRKVIELDIDARDQLTRKAKDVILGRRPLTDFEDSRLNGNLRIEDFESILQVAVLCVAKSSKGRPTVDVVFQELDKAWKNVVVIKKANSEKNTSETPQSRSLEVIAV